MNGMCVNFSDTIRRRMQLKGQNYSSTLDALKSIARTEVSP
jgi:hypothetical protein